MGWHATDAGMCVLQPHCHLSQAREFRTNTKQVAIERRTDLFRDKWVDEAALRYLGRKSKQEGLFAVLGQH